ncbi:hypothetical protein ACFX19_043220 [Malus domestica]
MDELRRHVEKDPWILHKIQEVFNNPAATDIVGNLRYQLDNEFLKFKHRIVISPQSCWRDKIFGEHQLSPIAGHEGFLKTYKQISRSFYWEGMKKYIKDMVSSCSICQQNKYETISPPGLLQPLPIPTKIWADISMDFIVGLPPCKGKTVIWVVIDRLSKYAHFLAIAHPYSATMIAQLFVDHIFKLHGMPNSIISDRDPVFMSKFWKEFFTIQGSKLCFSSSYHPQTNGQTEVLNRCLETYLRCFCSLQPRRWAIWLSWAEWSYNTGYHTATKMTPYEIVYGQPPPLVSFYDSGTTKVASVDQALQERNRVLAVLKANLQAAQNRMKVQSDKKRTERVFEVGDWVYLRLVPYQFMSLSSHSVHKLQPRFYRPFEILAKLGPVAYKLKLPETSKLHPVFHVSCLKKHLGDHVQPSVHLPVITESGILQDVPTAILDRRLMKKGHTAVSEVLVQWQNHTTEDATWENYHELKSKFPDIVHL